MRSYNQKLRNSWGNLMGKKYKKSYLDLSEAKLKFGFFGQLIDSLDYAILNFTPTLEYINFIKRAEYDSDIEDLKRDLEFKEERKKADIAVARKYLHDRQYNLDTVMLDGFSRGHDKKIDTAIVHLGMYADEYARSLNALAITVGNDIYFRNGAYKPETEDGRKLIAHELTHVSQNKIRNEQLSTTKKELEEEAMFEEQKEVYDPNSYIQYETGKNRYTLKKSEVKQLDYLVDKELKEWVEKQELNMPEEKFLKLLYKYKEYLESKI